MALPAGTKSVKVNAHKRNWRIKLLMLENHTTKNIRHREYRTITQIQIGSPIQIYIKVHLGTNRIYTNGRKMPY